MDFLKLTIYKPQNNDFMQRNIPKLERWKRKCPKCNRLRYYSSKYTLQDAIDNNSICKWCRVHTDKTKQKMSGKNNGMYGTHRYGLLNPFHGKQHTEESRRKMRISACKRVLEKSKNGRFANVNPKEHNYFKSLEKQNGWNGHYYGKSSKQQFIEELGYFVDYYEPNINLVIEYDEPRHYVYGNLREKDVKKNE